MLLIGNSGKQIQVTIKTLREHYEKNLSYDKSYFLSQCIVLVFKLCDLARSFQGYLTIQWIKFLLRIKI